MQSQSHFLRAGYYGPIHSIMKDRFKSDVDTFVGSNSQQQTRSVFGPTDRVPADSTTKSTNIGLVERRALAEISEQTHGIRQMIGVLHADVLNMKTNLATSEELSFDEQYLIKTAARHLVDALIDARTEHRSTREQLLKGSESAEEDVQIRTVPVAHSSQTAQPIEKHTLRVNTITRCPETTDNAIDSPTDSPHHTPTCITVLERDTGLAEVPSKTSLIIIDNEDVDEMISDVMLQTSKQFITIDEQFENIHPRTKRDDEDDILYLRVSLLDPSVSIPFALLSQSLIQLFASTRHPTGHIMHRNRTVRVH